MSVLPTGRQLRRPRPTKRTWNDIDFRLRSVQLSGGKAATAVPLAAEGVVEVQTGGSTGVRALQVEQVASLVVAVEETETGAEANPEAPVATEDLEGLDSCFLLHVHARRVAWTRTFLEGLQAATFEPSRKTSARCLWWT